MILPTRRNSGNKHASVLEWIKFSLLTTVCLATGGYATYQKLKGPARIKQEMAEKLRSGTDPMHSKGLPLEYTINRSDVVKSIQKLCLNQIQIMERLASFWVHQEGPENLVLFAKHVALLQALSTFSIRRSIKLLRLLNNRLAKAAGIPISPNIVDSVFRYLGFEDCPFYYFPNDPVHALTFVLNKVARRSKEAIIQDHLKQLPCFVIAASELLALYQPDLLDYLLRLAKYHVRSKKL